jgi:ribosomal protein S18 acetylase RimI-like enzyme
MSSSADALRVPHADDADAIAALFAGSRSLDAREVRSWFANPSFDPTSDFRVVERDGEVIAYADVHPEVDRLTVDWIADDEAAGHVLLDWAEDRARAEAIERVVTWAWPGSDVIESVVEARSFAPFRASLEMQVPLDDSTPAPAWPAGVNVRTVRSGEEREVHAVGEEAFADGNDFRPTPFEEWTAWWDDGRKRLDLWFAAEADGSLAGVALCELERAGAPCLGWVETLAVRRSWRRRGLGRGLLLHSFRAFRGLGRTAVGLSVDSENPTGAVRLYESVGMRLVSRRVLYEKRLSGASAL